MSHIYTYTYINIYIYIHKYTHTHTYSEVKLAQSCLTLYPMDYGAALAKMLQLCPTMCDPIDGSPAGSAIPGILQARTLEWVAISFSNA